MENIYMEIAKQISEPINPQLPVPVELSAIADTFTAEPGEKVWRYTEVDSALDICLVVDSNGAITTVKRTPTGDAELNFQGLNSKLEYVLVDDILSETDNVGVLGRRKSSITRAMDKRELWAIVSALLSLDAGVVPGVDPNVVTPVSGDDLYDVIMKMKHKVEDYGTDYVLLSGTTVKEKIDTYDKDKASTFNYNVTLTQKLKELGIDVMKVFGKVEVVKDAGEVAIMDTNSAILVARNSRIADGKPIKFVRRKIGAEIAKLMGADVDSAQRALMVNPTPVNIGGTNTLAYGVYGYESVIFTVTNPYAICIADLSAVVV